MDDSHNILIPKFLSGASWFEAPHTDSSSPSILMLQGPFPWYFHISGILAFSLGMQTCWNVQSGSVESRGLIPLLPTPQACSPAAPDRLLLPLSL